MCIYGMESPGGYQLVGRTLPIWESFPADNSIDNGFQPWLLRFFDQIQYYLVSDEQLEEMRLAYSCGKLTIDMESTTFNLAAHLKFLANNRAEIEAFEQRQSESYKAELQLWIDQGMINIDHDETNTESNISPNSNVFEIPSDCQTIEAPIGGRVSEISVKVGDVVVENQILLHIHSMKSDWKIGACCNGTVQMISTSTSANVSRGEILVIIRK